MALREGRDHLSTEKLYRRRECLGVGSVAEYPKEVLATGGILEHPELFDAVLRRARDVPPAGELFQRQGFSRQHLPRKFVAVGESASRLPYPQHLSRHVGKPGLLHVLAGRTNTHLPYQADLRGTSELGGRSPIVR